MSLRLDKSSWQTVRFGDVVKNTNENLREPASEGIDRIIALEHLDGGELEVTRWGSTEDSTTFTRRVRPGQTLFGKRRAYQRKVAYATFDAITSGDILTFDTYAELLLPELLPFLVQSEPFFTHALGTSAGSLSPRTNWGSLSRFEFSLPPLLEQHRLADLLWSGEQHHRALRNTKNSLIESERALLVSWLDSGNDRIPLSELIEISIGGLWGDEPGARQADVRVIRGTDIDEFGLPNLSHSPMRSISEHELSGRQLAAGDVLLEKSGGSPMQPVGKVGLVVDDTQPAICSNFVLRIVPDSKRIESQYLFLILRGMWLSGRFAPVTGKTTNISNLRVSELLSLKVSVPARTTQIIRIATWNEYSRMREITADDLDAQVRLSSVFLREVFG